MMERNQKGNLDALKTPIARDEMNQPMFDEMMRIGLEQAKSDAAQDVPKIISDLRRETNQT